MILSLHIFLALSSIIFSTIALFKPTETKQLVSYFMAGGTLLSGVTLVLVEPATMIRACVVGIVYFVAVSAIIYHTRNKLVLQKQNIHKD